jgi:hypothetical protein
MGLKHVGKFGQYSGMALPAAGNVALLGGLALGSPALVAAGAAAPYAGLELAAAGTAVRAIGSGIEKLTRMA